MRKVIEDMLERNKKIAEKKKNLVLSYTIRATFSFTIRFNINFHPLKMLTEFGMYCFIFVGMINYVSKDLGEKMKKIVSLKMFVDLKCSISLKN